MGNDHIQPAFKRRHLRAYTLPQPAFGAVADYRATNLFAYRKPHALLLTFYKQQRQVSAGCFDAFAIHIAELSISAQAILLLHV